MAEWIPAEDLRWIVEHVHVGGDAQRPACAHAVSEIRELFYGVTLRQCIAFWGGRFCNSSGKHPRLDRPTAIDSYS